MLLLLRFLHLRTYIAGTLIGPTLRPYALLRMENTCARGAHSFALFANQEEV
jgi:hypothetical protein